MDNQTVPFGTPAPVNRRRSNIIASRLQGEKSTPARGSNSSFRKQLFQEAAVAAAASSSSNRTTTDERIANTTVVDFELGTPIPCKQMADTSMRMDMTPASISKSLGERPNFLTPRLVKPDEKAFNSTGLMSKRKKAITDSASSMALSDDMTRSTASNSASRMHVGGVPDTPCKRSPTDFVPGKGLSNTLFMAQQTPRPAAPFVRSSLKHPLSLSGDQERSRKRLHIDNHDDNDDNDNNHNATDVNSPMVYSPEFPKSNKSIGSNSGNTTPPTARTLISIPSSPIRENSFLRDAPSPTPSGSESPLSIATRPYPYRATMMTRDRSSGQQASHSSTMMTIPDTPPLQHTDGIGDVDDPPSSPCVWHDANEEILLSQEDPIIHAPPANSLLHRLVTARHNKETNNERFAMEKKLNKLIVNDYTTLFAHFLRSSYFEQLDQEQGQPFVLPDVENSASTPSTSDMYTQYFDSEFTIIRKLGSGEFSEAFAARTSSDPRVYAVKRTKFPFSGVRDRARQLQEVRILWHVGKHPHCIQLIDAWEQQGHLYLQTELCSRGTLKDYLDIHCNNEQIEEEQIWSFFADIAMGIKHLHSLNILHLDLKPANIFLDDQDRLKIGDFGMAVFYPTKRSDEREGDREYMAPEILNGDYGRPADIFSLGLIILEMAINVVMPDNGVAWQKLRSNDFSDCDFSSVSDNLASCIRRLLAAVPDTRPTIDHILEEPEIRRIIESRHL